MIFAFVLGGNLCSFVPTRPYPGACGQTFGNHETLNGEFEIMVSGQVKKSGDRPLRIAFLVRGFPEVSNTFILSQITGLIERGHAIDIFALRSKPFEGSHADVARYALDSRMRHLPVPENRLVRLWSAATLLFIHGIRHSEIFSALDPRRFRGSAWGLTQIHTAASFIRAAGYDVLHCQFGDLGPAGERLVALGSGRTKLVTSFRGNDLTCHLSVRPRFFADLLRRGDLFMPVTRDFHDRLLTFGIPSDRIVVHRSGINLRRFAVSPRQAPQGATELLFVGRLTEKKGLAYLLDAVSMLVGSGRDVRLTVIGEGELGPMMRARCHELGIADHVSFFGSGTQEQVVSAMQKSHILVAPSVTAANGDQEGIPNVLKEAMATGMPVVSTYHSGIPELVEHGVSGLLAPERDAMALAALLTELVDHPESWPSFGAAARRKVEEEYDSERLNDELVAAYRGLLR